MLDPTLISYLRIQFAEFEYKIEGARRIGYWTRLSDDYDAASFIDSHWRKARKFDTRLFLAGSNLRMQFSAGFDSARPSDTNIYAMPLLPVIDVVRLASCGIDYL